mgnify:FL=1
MVVVKIIMLALMAIASVFVIVVVMKQKGDSEGMQALSGSSSSETFFGKNKAKSKDAMNKKLTYIALGVLAFCSIVYFILQAIG